MGDGLTFLAHWAMQTWDMVLEAAPWLLGGFLLAGVLHVFVSVDRIARHLGRGGWAGVLKASLIGLPLPLCSCSVIPVASSIRKQGASKGAFVSFLISTPETGVDSIAISYALLGPVLAVVRPLAALVTAFAAGLLVDRLDAADTLPDAPTDEHPMHGASRELQPARTEVHGSPRTAEACENGCGCAPERPETAQPGKLIKALRYGFVDMFADLAPYLLAGFLLAGLVSALIPADFFDRYVGTGITPMLVMLMVGLPLYVCATASTPIAAALIAGGLSPGAALVFLLVGPATNIATMLIVARDVGRRGLIVYLATIMVVALAFGVVTNLAADSWPVLPARVADAHWHGTGGVAQIPGVVLALLTLNGLRMRLTRRAKPHPAGSVR